METHEEGQYHSPPWLVSPSRPQPLLTVLPPCSLGPALLTCLLFPGLSKGLSHLRKLNYQVLLPELLRVNSLWSLRAHWNVTSSERSSLTSHQLMIHGRTPCRPSHITLFHVLKHTNTI